VTWFKFLAGGAVGTFSGYRWPAPALAREPGEWVTAESRLDPCRSGLHVCRSADLPFWVHEELYVVEIDGPVTEYESFVLASRARLVQRVDWGRPAAGAFSRACTWRVRDLAAEALQRRGRLGDADRLLECTTLDDLAGAVGRLDRADDTSAGDVSGYVADAVSFTGGVEDSSGWASAAATTGFVAAAAARSTAEAPSGAAAWLAERRRQASWIADLAER
jgi:hypothetical protein